MSSPRWILTMARSNWNRKHRWLPLITTASVNILDAIVVRTLLIQIQFLFELQTARPCWLVGEDFYILYNVCFFRHEIQLEKKIIFQMILFIRIIFFEKTRDQTQQILIKHFAYSLKSILSFQQALNISAVCRCCGKVQEIRMLLRMLLITRYHSYADRCVKNALN